MLTYYKGSGLSDFGNFLCMKIRKLDLQVNAEALPPPRPSQPYMQVHKTSKPLYGTGLYLMFPVNFYLVLILQSLEIISLNLEYPYIPLGPHSGILRPRLGPYGLEMLTPAWQYVFGFRVEGTYYGREP